MGASTQSTFSAVHTRHCRRAWPSKGKRIVERREAMQLAIRRDFSGLFEDAIPGGSYSEVRQQLTYMLRLIRSNTRQDVRRITARICNELVGEWLEQDPRISKALVHWSSQIANDRFAGIGQAFAQGLLQSVSDYEASIPKQKTFAF